MQQYTYLQYSSMFQRGREMPFYGRESQPNKKQLVSCLRTQTKTQTPTAALEPPKKVIFSLSMIADYEAPEDHERPQPPAKPMPAKSCLKKTSLKQPHSHVSGETRGVQFNEVVNKRLYSRKQGWDEPLDHRVRLRDEERDAEWAMAEATVNGINPFRFPAPPPNPSLDTNKQKSERGPSEEGIFAMDDIYDQLCEAEKNGKKHWEVYEKSYTLLRHNPNFDRGYILRDSFAEMDRKVDQQWNEALKNAGDARNDACWNPSDVRRQLLACHKPKAKRSAKVRKVTRVPRLELTFGRNYFGVYVIHTWISYSNLELRDDTAQSTASTDNAGHVDEHVTIAGRSSGSYIHGWRMPP
ncbi:hypothetical protein CPLU01_14910 [Colletotrichum plurivorum]|uniref:Uncharacterized protein n=1 Tax=Colletotrichum plurivorum TaxID=2175906 RepID=A0A8H6JG70_9PEZI|nr:hypothetical protein CPLU01_14910 [Colletotrichum plurivorum]